MTNLDDARAEIVSFDTEPLILVNEADEPCGRSEQSRLPQTWGHLAPRFFPVRFQ
jgi:hypothetical protein